MQHLIIIPTYNEAETIGTIINAISAQKLTQTEVLVVDDNSPDGTAEIVKSQFIQVDTGIKVHLLQRPTKEGLGAAYIAGFKWALSRDCSLIIQMDADFSHDPKYLPTMISMAQSSADLVLGSRYIPGGGTENWGLIRKLISRAGSLYARFILGVKIQDFTGGFKCFKREVLTALPLDEVYSHGYSFQIEMTYRAHLLQFEIQEIPITFVDRRVGQSKMSKAIIIEGVFKVLLLRIRRRKLKTKSVYGFK
jgi:dolichol-phosphate mannosyltransferase